jgi:hypothetical protein
MVGRLTTLLCPILEEVMLILGYQEGEAIFLSSISAE